MKSICRLLTFALVVIGNAANSDVTLSRVDEEFNLNQNTNPHLVIKGEIKRSDYAKALNAVKDAYVHGDIGQLFVKLDSPGGDVLEAMKIGDLVRQLKLTTIVGRGQCNSACVFVLVAGTNRIAPSGIGIHRPFFEREYFSGLSADDAQKKYEEMMDATNSYLVEMGMAKELIERMFRVPSNEVEELSLEEVQKWISGSPASLDEWLIAKCESYTTKDEADDYSMWLAHRINLKPGYAKYLKQKITKVDGCRMGTLANERNRVAAKLFPSVKKAKMPNNQLNEDASR